MATTNPPSFDDALQKQELCLPFDEAIETLPIFLQPSDEQERDDLAMFLSQVDELHKHVVGKLSASSVLNYLKRMLKHVTSTSGSSQATFTEQMQELTGNIALEIASNVINDVDLHDTTISVLNILQEVSWESKVALTITSFVLTFGDKGLNLCEESKVSVDEIQMFAELKGGYNKHRLESTDNLFAVVFQLFGSIVEFESLPTTCMTSKNPKVKAERTHLIVIVYWIIRIIVAAATSHIIKFSSKGNESDKTILALRELPSRWSKNLKDLNDNEHIKAKLSNLQNLLGKDVDIEAYNKIKDFVEQENHSDNLEVLNVLFPSVAEDADPLYDCLNKRKVHLDVLKGTYVLLLISGIENIAPEVDETKLDEFINNYDSKSDDEVACKIVWMPIIDRDRSVQQKQATQKSIVKPFLDWCYIVHQKLNQVVEYFYEKPKNLKGWYSVNDPLKISNEVKKFIRDDWNYKKSEAMIVVLDPQGNVVNHNAIHLLYLWSTNAFPFTSKSQEHLWDTRCGFKDVFPSIYAALPQPLENSHDYIFYYGGENMEWIKSLTGMMHQIERELKDRIIMVYVGRSHNQEMMQSVKEENLSHCLSDQVYLWLFWTRIKSIVYSGIHAERFYKNSYDETILHRLQMLLTYDKSNVGWAVLSKSTFRNKDPVWHGKVVLSTLKEFKIWKDKASNEGFKVGFTSHYNELYRKIFPFQRREFPTTALKAPIDTMLCPDCNNPMQQYTTFVCYHQ